MIHLLLAAVSGIILSLAFPGRNVEAAVWLWLYPLLAALWLGVHTKKRTFGLGLIAGVCYACVDLSWVRHSSRVINGATGSEWMGIAVEAMGWGAVLGLSLFVAAHFGLWALFAARIARPRKAVMIHGHWLEASVESIRAAALAAAAWVALEWVRGWFLTGFGWNGLGVALHQNKVLIQAADLIGVAGLSFLPVLCSCIIFNVVHRLVLRSRTGGGFRYTFDTLFAMLLIGAQAMYGLHKLGEPVGETIPVRVALVQLNVPQVDIFTRANLAERYHRFADLTRLCAATRDGEQGSPMDLVVWPESALGLGFAHPDHEPFFNELLATGDFSLLAGCDVGDSENPPSYNSAALLRGGWKDAQLYHKVHLVPFGEYVPLRHSLPFMEATVGQIIQSDLAFGPSTEPLKLAKPEVQIIPLICFEDSVGSLARKFVRDAPQMIVNVTNDGWFLQSSGPEQHLNNALFRAIELRRPLCRACNSGVTSFIDDRGRVVAALRDPETGSTFFEGLLPSIVQVAKHPTMTLYARWGDWFAMLCALLCLGAYITAFIAARRSS